MQRKTVYNIHMTALQKAIDAIQSGQKSAALGLLKQAITENPADPTAWVWLARVVDDPAKKRECLQRALRLDPQHKFAQKTLDELDGRVSTPPTPPVPAAPPAAVQPSAGRSLQPQTPVMKIDDALLKTPPAPQDTPPAEAQPAGAVLIGAQAYQPEPNPVFKEPELPTTNNAVFNAAARPPAARPDSTASAFSLSSTELENFMNAELVEVEQTPPAPRAAPAPLVEKRPAAASQAAKRPAAARRHARRPSLARQALIALFVILALAAILALVIWLVK